MSFKLNAPFQPTGDQPEAIAQLIEGFEKGQRHQVLLGATGTGKTFTMANLIQHFNKPALIIAHNKTLVAQLYAEFKEFFPENAVAYFVSYYDYYQPEAYVPRHDLYIEKETDVNEEIERLRLAATTALLSRKDVIIVASVSCIYGLGNPEAYGKVVIELKVGHSYRRTTLLRQLVESQYSRNDIELAPGAFRVRGDTLEVAPAYEDRYIYRISFWGDEVERIVEMDYLTGEIRREMSEVSIFPAKHFITQDEKLEKAIEDIQAELEERIEHFKSTEQLLEAQRIEQRARYDLEMLREVGYCSGIENYSRHLDQRPQGSPPWTLMDYLPDDYLLIIDESHISMSQVRSMYNGDHSRKKTLVEYGWRLPSAIDNRPLKFVEFEKRIQRAVYVSATPGPYELKKAGKKNIAEQLIRPTGLLDPTIEIVPTGDQIEHLKVRIKERVENDERIIVTTLTKRMAEDLSEYLAENNIKVNYLHSEIKTLDRLKILRDFRQGLYHVIVGVNLLREGLDLPEVSLIGILDADKEGFLRNTTTLIQTMGRAARHINGHVILYADKETKSIKAAVGETQRRRKTQKDYNKKNNITPKSITRKIDDFDLPISKNGILTPQTLTTMKSSDG